MRIFLAAAMAATLLVLLTEPVWAPYPAALSLWLISGHIIRALRKLARRSAGNWDDTAVHAADRLLRVLLVGALAVYSAILAGIDITHVAAGAGLGTVMLIVACKDYLLSAVSSLSLLFGGTLCLGDEITIAGYRGVVSGIGLRNTKIVNGSGDLILIPNKLFFGSVMVNHTSDGATGEARPVTVAVEVHAARGAEIERLIRVLRSHLTLMSVGSTRVIRQDDDAAVHITGMGNGCVHLEVSAYHDASCSVGIKQSRDAVALKIMELAEEHMVMLGAPDTIAIVRGGM